MDKKFYTDISQEFVESSIKKFRSAQRIVITSHKSPDDDSIASVLSMFTYLTKYLGIDEEKVRIIYTGEYVNRWSYFKNYDKVEYVDDIYNYLKGDELLVILDCSGWMRFSRNEKIKEYKGDTICIDHHGNADGVHQLHLKSPKYNSVSDLIFRLYLSELTLDKDICEILLVGILGDTGNLRYVNSSQADIFDIVKKLILMGKIDVDLLQSKYMYLSQAAFVILGEFMKNYKIIETRGWPSLVMSYIGVDFINGGKFSELEVSDASHAFTIYLNNIKDISWGIVATPRIDNSTSLSCRSIPGSVNVRLLMEKMGIGGGHDRAAGGKLPIADPSNALNSVLAWMEKHTPVIN